jgi:hypothetical protein
MANFYRMMEEGKMSDARSLKKAMAHDRMVLLAPLQLFPTEDFIEERVLQVSRDIIREGYWREPILVERTSLVIMDGHHRREFARRHSLVWVPCLMHDYSEVELSSWRAGVDVCPEDVIARGLQRRPYPPKTTRHIVGSNFSHQCRYPLSEMMLAPPGRGN